MVTLAGLVYVLLKHFVDRYNIFFAYAPSRINKNIHTSAINFVMIAFLIPQLTLFSFSLLRLGLHGVTVFALCGFCATLFFIVGQASFHWFRSLAPISYRVSPADANAGQSDAEADCWPRTADLKETSRSSPPHASTTPVDAPPTATCVGHSHSLLPLPFRSLWFCLLTKRMFNYECSMEK